MGYMGFGMRKENYTRKPKKAFDKLKKVYGQKPDFPKSNVSKSGESPISFEKHSYKPFYRTKLYRVIRNSILMIIGLCLIWSIFLQEPYDVYRKSNFEKEGFSEFYKSDLNFLNQVFKLMEKRSDKLISIESYRWSDEYDIRLKHPSIDTAKSSSKVFNLGFYGGYGKKRPENKDVIKNGILTKEGFEHAPYKSRWIYNLKGVTESQIPVSVASYLEMEAAQFTHFLALAHKFGDEIEYYNGMIYANYYHKEYGHYQIVYSKYGLEPTTEMKYGRTYFNYVGKLDKNVYWTRQEMIELRK